MNLLTLLLALQMFTGLDSSMASRDISFLYELDMQKEFSYVGRIEYSLNEWRDGDCYALQLLTINGEAIMRQYCDDTPDAYGEGWDATSAKLCVAMVLKSTNWSSKYPTGKERERLDSYAIKAAIACRLPRSSEITER